MPEIFISSCTRRQLARRRPVRGIQRLQALMWMVLLLAAVVVPLAARGII